IEQHVEWVADLLTHLRESDTEVVEAEAGAEVEWSEHVQAAGRMTLYPETDSWYMGANIPGKPRVFLPYIGGVGYYRQHCARLPRVRGGPPRPPLARPDASAPVGSGPGRWRFGAGWWRQSIHASSKRTMEFAAPLTPCTLSAQALSSANGIQVRNGTDSL